MVERVFAAVLAGGRSRRFGSNKAAANLCGKPMIGHVVARLRHQAEQLAVVGNGELARLVAARSLDDAPVPVKGPLAGVLAALQWTREEQATWLVTAPCDVPLLPKDMAMRLVEAAQKREAEVVVAASASGVHPLCAVWNTSFVGVLAEELSRGVHPPVYVVTKNAPVIVFEEEEAFTNVNTVAELSEVDRRIATAQAEKK